MDNAIDDLKLKKIEKIEDSIKARWSLFPVDKVNLIPFNDDLKNLIQDRIIICYCEKIDTVFELLFHTFQDPFYRENLNGIIKNFLKSPNNIIPLNEILYCFVLKFHVHNDPKEIELKENNDVCEWISDLIKKIKADTIFYKDLNKKGFNTNEIKSNIYLKNFSQPIKKTLQEGFSLNKEKYANEIRDLIEDCISDAHASLLLNTKLEENLFIPNLFAVIGYPIVGNKKRMGVYNYTAQILLTKNQKDNIKEWVKKEGNIINIGTGSGGEEFVSELETPLGDDSRSITDTPFCTGYVEYSAIAGHGRDYACSDKDKRRQLVEEVLYQKITGEVDKSKRIVNFIPIFVNGVPWIIFYSLHKEDEGSGAWDSNRILYRDLISKVGTSIRIKAKGKYLDQVQKILAEVLPSCNNEDEYVKVVNTRLSELSCFFPFQVPVFKVIRKEPKYFLRCVSYDIIENEYWDKYVGYDIIKDEDIKIAVNAKLQTLIYEQENISKDKELIAASYSISHLIKNKLDEPEGEVQAIINNLDYLIENSGLKLSKEQFHPRFETYKKYIEDLRNTLKVLDLIPKASHLGENNYNVFFTKDNLLREGELNLKDIIEEVAKRKNINLKWSPHIKQCIILPFIVDNNGKEYAPGKFLYENCFTEVMMNFLNSTPDKSYLEVIKIYDEESNLAIAFRNKANVNDKIDNDYREVSPQFGFYGAIGYLRTVMDMIGVANIKKKVFIDSDTKIKLFELAIFFKGLKINEE